MKRLYELVASRRDWLTRRILQYAKDRRHVKYSSALEKAWQLSSVGLSASLLQALETSEKVPELGPDDDYNQDPIASFGIAEAQRCRERGVDLGMFLGLLKYCRQSYIDLVRQAGFTENHGAYYRPFVERFFDRIEIGFCTEWATAHESQRIKQLQFSNRVMMNEKNKYVSIFESLPNPVVLVDRENRIERINHAAATLFLGSSIPGAQYHCLLRDRYLEQVEAQEASCARSIWFGGEPAEKVFPWLANEMKGFDSSSEHRSSFETGVQSEAGMQHFHVILAKMLDISGKFSGVMVIVHDITKRKQAEAELRQKEEKYRNLVERANDGIMIIQDGLLKYVNPRLAEMTGFSVEEATGTRFADYIHPDERDEAVEYYKRRMAGEEMQERHETALSRKDGGKIDVELNAGVIKYQGKPADLVIIRDISVYKRADEALRKARDELERRVAERTAELVIANEQLRREIEEREHAEVTVLESEKRYSTLIENSLTGIYIEQDGKIAFANNRFSEIYGYSRDEVVGIESWRLVHPEDRLFINDVTKKRLKGEKAPSEYEARGLTEDGETIWTLRRNTRIEYQGRPAVLGNIEEITQRKLMQRALQESEKELRLLSSHLLTAQEKERQRIAQELHDSVGQYLSAIKFSVETTLQEMGRETAAADVKSSEAVILMIQEAIEEVRRIVMNLRPSTLDDLGILATIAWFCREFQAIYSGIRIQKQINIKEEDVPDHLKPVIYRVLQEAFNNVAKHSDADFVSLRIRKTDGTIELAIEDNGQGFDLDDAFSVDTPRKGLGLVSMKERIELSGGAHTIKSAKGAGTVVLASWPCIKT